MHQIKFFTGLESGLDMLEEKVNTWLADCGAEVVEIFGNIAPQTVTSDASGKSLGGSKFSSSDLFITVVYKANP